MKKALTILTFMFFCLSMTQKLSAQIEFSMPDVIDLNCGDSFCLPVTSTGFVSIGAVSGSINWDANALEYTGITNAALPNFSTPANVNELGADDGEIGFVWFDATGMTPLTLGAGATVFEVCFEVLAPGNNSPTIVEFTDTPTIFSVAQQPSDPTSPPFPLTVTLTNGTVYTDCGSSNMTCNNHLNISVDPWSCGATLTPEMGLEGGPYDISVMEIDPLELTADDIGVDVLYTVTNTETNNTCWGYITLEDKTPPVPVAKQNVKIHLDADCSFIIDATEIDNGSYDSCSEVSYTVEPYEFDESDIGFQEVLLTVEDASGNSNSIYFEIEVVGNQCAERLQVYEQVNIVLNGNEPFILDPEMLIINNYSNYDQFDVAPFSVDTSDIGDQPYLVSAPDDETDWGNLNVCETAASITSCVKILVSIGPSQTAVATLDKALLDINYTCTEKGYLTSFSNTQNNVTAQVLDCSYTDIPGGLHNYTAYLWTGNILVDSCTNILQVLDGAGHCDNPTNSSSLTCNDFVQVSADPWGCSASFSPEMVLEGGPYDYSTITVTPSTLTELNEVVTYEVEDSSNGNMCWGTITLVDKTPPIAIAVQDLVVSLTTSPSNPQPLKAKVYAEQVDNGSHDGTCGPVAFKPAYWEFTCADIGEQTITMEVWDDADGDGVPGSSPGDNFSVVWTTITIQLPTGIVLVCPSVAQVDCSEDLSDGNVTGIPTVTIGCENALTYVDNDGFDENDDGDLYDEFEYNGVTYSESHNKACNSGAIEREWKVGDASCLQRILVTNDTEFDGDDITWPEDVVVECYDEPVQPSWESIEGCSLVGLTLESQIFSGLPNGCDKILNTYSVINWCEYDPLESGVGVWSHTSLVEFSTSEAPQITTEFVTLSGCGDLSLSSVGTQATCPNSHLSWKVSLDLNNDSIIDAIWSSDAAEDENTISSPLWDDDDGDGIPEVRVGNTGGVDNASGNRIESGTPYVINLPSWLSFDNNPNTVHGVLWEVSNSCGLSSSSISSFTLGAGSQDLNAPAPYCINLASVLVSPVGVEIYAIDFDRGSFDNCTPQNELRFTFTDVEPGNDPNYISTYRSSYEKLNVDDFTQQVTDVVRPIYVWDNAGNRDFCLVSLRVLLQEDPVVVDPCFDESDINWPDPLLEVHSGDAISTSPEDLMNLYGFTEDQVLPIIPGDCGIYDYHDTPLDVDKILRNWIVLDWLASEVYNFDQIIKIFPAGLANICDFLPNNTPFTDCDNGHSMDDDVEWPADIAIADHRITPEGLMAFSNIPAKDAQPEFFNNAASYIATYENFIPTFTIPFLEIERRWTVSQAGFVGSSSEYTQKITVDLTDVLGLVATTTFGNRPIPEVQITPQDFTGENGVVVVDENALIDPTYSDVNHNGLTIRDLALIQRHILGIDLLEGYAVNAADFNRDRTIDGRDLVDIRRHLTGVFSEDIDWVFIERAAELTELGIRADYVGVKPGDIDDSAAIGNNIPENETVQFHIDDLLLNNGESYGIPVEYSSPSIFSNALHLSLDFDESALELVGITSEIYDGFIDYHLEDNILNLVVFSPPLTPALIGADLITIQVKAKENTTLANVIGFNGDRPSHILTNDFVLYDMNGEVGNTFGSGTHNLDGKQIAIYPNPATDFMTLDIPTTVTKDFSFEIMDISGKSILTAHNEININLGDIPNGIYLYKFIIGNKLFSDKIIIQK